MEGKLNARKIIYVTYMIFCHWRSVGLDFATIFLTLMCQQCRVDSFVECTHSLLLIFLNSHDVVISRHTNLMLTRSQQQLAAPV